MNSDLFLILLSIGPIVSLAYPFVAVRLQLSKSTQVKQIRVFLIGTALLTGLLTGTFYSHGLDIYWWMFSLLYLVICLAFLGLGKLIIWLKRKSN